MLVELAGERLALPLDVISEVLRVGDADIRTLGGGRVLNWRGQILPVIDAAERLQLRPAQEVLPPDSLALVLERGGRSVCCLVDEVVGHEEVVIKPVSKLVSTLPEVSGATVLGVGGSRSSSTRNRGWKDRGRVKEENQHGPASPGRRRYGLHAHDVAERPGTEWV